MAGMEKRDVGFLLIGLGAGLSLSIAFAVSLLRTVHSLGMIVAYSWERAILLVPVGLVTLGLGLIFYKPKRLG
jgi:hypothetical protein